MKVIWNILHYTHNGETGSFSIIELDDEIEVESKKFKKIILYFFLTKIKGGRLYYFLNAHQEIQEMKKL